MPLIIDFLIGFQPWGQRKLSLYFGQPHITIDGNLCCVVNSIPITVSPYSNESIRETGMASQVGISKQVCADLNNLWNVR